MTDYGLYIALGDRHARLLLSGNRQTLEVITSSNWRISTSGYCHSFTAGEGITKAWRGATLTTIGLGTVVHGIHTRLSEQQIASGWIMSYDSNGFRLQAPEALEHDDVLDIWNIVTSELARDLEPTSRKEKE